MKIFTLFMLATSMSLTSAQIYTIELSDMPAPPSFYNWEIPGQYDWNTSIQWLTSKSKEIFYESDKQEPMSEVSFDMLEGSSLWEIHKGQSDLLGRTGIFDFQYNTEFSKESSNKRENNNGFELWKTNKNLLYFPEVPKLIWTP